MPSTSGKVTLSIRLPEELDARLREEAELQGRSLSAIAEAAIRETLDRWQR
jgi:predicted transcriptional regulator